MYHRKQNLLLKKSNEYAVNENGMAREENVTAFKDTEKQVKGSSKLKNAVANSSANQKLILETDEISVPDKDRYQNTAEVIVSKKRTLEAASGYKGLNICVHNFASATNPGGGVVRGSSAQEECLCRCSTLYFNLNLPDMWAGFYTPHRMEHNPIRNDDCIYTPDVVVIKKPMLMPENEWYKVNMITCAVPNLREKPSNMMNSGDGDVKVKITDDELLAIHEKRFSRILDIALTNNNDVVILGAFGCGAFENNPSVVAAAAKNVVEKYIHAFRVIEFAVYCSPRDSHNYDVFKSVLGNMNQRYKR